MAVDSYRYLPRSLAAMVQAWPAERLDPIPWAPLRARLGELKLALVTTAGVYVEGREPPFDAERERREPTWGDPSYRTIPHDVAREGIGASHLHVNNEFVRQDLNVALPLDHAEDALSDGLLGGLAETHYSFMGFQLDTGEWERRYAPEVAERMRSDGVDVALLTPGCPDCCRTLGVLARAFEERGISTVLVTMMPAWSARLGVPRTLGVEHPYGQAMGPAGDRARQREVFRQALEVLARAPGPDYITESDYEWPDPKQARKSWHPPEQAPIVRHMLEQSKAQ